MPIWLKFCILAIVLSGISACTQSADCFREEVFCAALVTDTRGLNDFGINQDTWAGLEQSHSDGLVDQIAHIESVNPKDYEKNIASFVDAGYDVIITSGVGLRDATLHNADLYPESVFIGMNQADDESVPNFISVTFPEDQMGFLAGVLAARLTKTKIVGAVCETSEIDSMRRYCEGFRAGVNHADESVKALIVYRDNESRDKLLVDSEWGYDNAQNLIQEGSDVIFAAGGETAVGALRATGEADVRSIGVERDQGMALGGEESRVVTSILGRTSFTVQELIRRVRSGDLTEPKLNPLRYIALDSTIQKSLSAEMDALLADLANGEIETHVSVEKP